MDENDDFELIDSDKGFDMLEDDGISRNDELGAISNLNREMAEVQEMKKRLKAQHKESQQLLAELSARNASTKQLQSQLQRELKAAQKMRASLDAQQESFKAQKAELASMLQSMQSVPSTVSKGKGLVEQLSAFFAETRTVEGELEKLKALRVRQEEMVAQCKVNIESINSRQRDCLVSLDQSKAFSCKECGTDIALKEDIESKCYQVGQGTFTEKKRGYLFSNAVNTVLGAKKTENFTTGAYQIAWAKCAKCQAQMGWKYISAESASNTSKEGKFCLARHGLTSPEDRAQNAKK